MSSPHYQLPYYLSEAFTEFLNDDSLLVLGKGMGLISLLAVLCRYYGEKTSNNDESVNKNSINIKRCQLIIVLGLEESEQNTIVSFLNKWNTSFEFLPKMVNNHKRVGCNNRKKIYQQGGVCFVTSRIFIVDLLGDIILSTLVGGIVVTHAESCLPESTEAFILRLVRNRCNSNTFIKAITDRPECLISSFSKVDLIMKSLHVSRLILYPRFHFNVINELERDDKEKNYFTTPIVEQVIQPLTYLMKEIQNFLVVAVQKCLRQLEMSTSIIQWSDIDLSIEAFMQSNFNSILSQKLQDEWHILSFFTKQLLYELKTLKSLFQYLLQYDCITFYKFLQCIQSIEKKKSYWNSTSTNYRLGSCVDGIIYQKSKERVYNVLQQQNTGPHTKSNKTQFIIEPILEENPKWKRVYQLLKEIQQSSFDTNVNSTKKEVRENILIMVKELHSLESIKAYLIDGKYFMLKRWLHHLETTQPPNHPIGITTLFRQEEDRVRKLLNNTINVISDERSHINIIPKWKKYKYKVRQNLQRIDRNYQLYNEHSTTHDEAKDEAVQFDSGIIKVSSANTNSISSHISSSNSINQSIFHAEEVQSQLHVYIQMYSTTDGESSLLLHTLQPSVIILYDVELFFLRELEIYSALKKQIKPNLYKRIHVYVIRYEDSSEDFHLNHQSQCEIKAFEGLIQHKKQMPASINTTCNGIFLQLSTKGLHLSYAGGDFPCLIDTRTKIQSVKEKRNIAIDIREFRSCLPSILHKGGMVLTPVTLTVGDYVLSSAHCIERKSINDLYNSFANGRLYHQIDVMSKYYTIPCLLIEFDVRTLYKLQSEIDEDINIDYISSKLIILTLHFPKLRILWCITPYETLKVFKALKITHEEVNVNKAVELGSGVSQVKIINEISHDILLKFPWLTFQMVHKIVYHCKNLVEFVTMSKEDLKNLLGSRTGDKIFHFLNQMIDNI